MNVITKFQIKKIHTLKNILGIEDDLYREMLEKFGVKSSKELTYTEAVIFVELLEYKAEELGLWKIKPKKYSGINKYGNLVSEAQLRLIEALWREICYFDTDEFATKSLRKYLALKFKVFDFKLITKAKASKIIQSIIKMKGNIKKNLKEEGAAAL